MKSPGYPYNYQNEMECIYTISVAENNIIKISFFEFDLEHNTDCRNDFLEINDGESEFSPLIERFCGDESNVQQTLYSKQTKIGNVNEIPKILYSTQNKMWIRFV